MTSRFPTSPYPTFATSYGCTENLQIAQINQSCLDFAMKAQPDRNHRIAHSYLDGVSARTLAAEYGLKDATIRNIVKKMLPLIRRQDDRPIPDGMSLHAALSIENAIGIWPSAESAQEILERRGEIMRSHGKMRETWEQIEIWLRSLGISAAPE